MSGVKIMAATILFLCCGIFTLAAMNSNGAKALAPDAMPSSPDLTQKILVSTIHIRIYDQDNLYKSDALGSLFTFQGEQFVLTHSHWSTLSPGSRVVFTDWQNGYLQEITGQQFLDLVQYRDAGSLVLHAPENLCCFIFPLQIPENLGKNEQVMLAQVDPGSPDQLKVVEGRISAVKQGEIPGYEISTFARGQVIHGDSGGGVWHENQLIGNLWCILIRPAWLEFFKTYQESFVAGIPAGFHR